MTTPSWRAITGVTISGQRISMRSAVRAHRPVTRRMIARGGNAVGAVLGGLLATVMPIRAAFGVLAVSEAVGAGLAGWASPWRHRRHQRHVPARRRPARRGGHRAP